MLVPPGAFAGVFVAAGNGVVVGWTLVVFAGVLGVGVGVLVKELGTVILGVVVVVAAASPGYCLANELASFELYPFDVNVEEYEGSPGLIVWPDAVWMFPEEST